MTNALLSRYPSWVWRPRITVVAITLGLAPWTPATAVPKTGSVSPQAAPQAWLDYAQRVSDAVQARLAGDDDAAARLRDYLDQFLSAGDAAGTTLKLAFWIDSAGAVTRIDHAPFAQPAANDDLRAVIVGLRIAVPPPKGMLLPLRLSIAIKPKDQGKVQAWTTRSPLGPGSVHVRYGVMPGDVRRWS